MKQSADLKRLLTSIDHKSYPAYKDVRGAYDFNTYILSIDHVQGDPFASPSKVSVQVRHAKAGFPAELFDTPWKKTALEDYLLRCFSREIGRLSFKAKGSGKSGLIATSRPGQEVLSRTACEIGRNEITARFEVGFPAFGRTINSGELIRIFFDFLPGCVENVFFYRRQNNAEIKKRITLADDQQFIRNELKRLDLVSFVADGSILPRETGVSDRPMKGSVAFHSPDSLRITLNLPGHGPISGMAIHRGITLIVGGGYHGKSTLLNALELGVYNHISGDGREYVITDDTALKLRSEDGRFIKDVDISLFINDLPNKKDTRCFSTEDASGSTSQAAGIVEGMEAGSRVFLLDEDTSATNFMVRDTFMQKVISREKEPITPFLERAEDLYKKAGISTILVAGSSGAFFHIADTIIQMDSYHPVDISEKVRALCGKYPLNPVKASAFAFPASHRIMKKQAPSIRSHGRNAGRPEQLKIKVHGKDGFLIGKQDVDLRYVEQLIDPEQTAALGLLLKYAIEKLADDHRTVADIIEILSGQLEQNGLSFLSGGSYISCGYAMPRLQEIYSCFNRYRR